MNHNILDSDFEDESNEEYNSFNSNKPQLRERPPRQLNAFTKITLINGELLAQIGWGFLGFGMIFFWFLSFNPKQNTS